MDKFNTIFLLLFVFSSALYAQEDTTYAYLNRYREAINTSYQKNFDSVAETIHQPPIKQQDGNLSLRLWEYTMWGETLSSIRKVNGKWESSRLQLLNRGIKEKVFYPVISLDQVIATLTNFPYKNFPNQFELVNFTYTVDDGIRYALEIVLNGHYYHLAYDNPATYASKDKYNKQFADLISVLSSYFKEQK